MMLFSKIAYYLNRLSRALKLTSLQSKTRLFKFCWKVCKIKLKKRKLEGIYTWNSSPDEIIPVYGEMSLTVYTLLPRWNLIPGWKSGMEFHPGMKKKKKTCKHFIPWWNFKMSMFLINFWRIYSNMFSKVNVFEHNESINVKKQEASLHFVFIIFFEEFRKDWNSSLL